MTRMARTNVRHGNTTNQFPFATQTSFDLLTQAFQHFTEQMQTELGLIHTQLDMSVNGLEMQQLIYDIDSNGQFYELSQFIQKDSKLMQCMNDNNWELCVAGVFQNIKEELTCNFCLPSNDLLVPVSQDHLENISDDYHVNVLDAINTLLHQITGRTRRGEDTGPCILQFCSKENTLVHKSTGANFSVGSALRLMNHGICMNKNNLWVFMPVPKDMQVSIGVYVIQDNDQLPKHNETQFNKFRPCPLDKQSQVFQGFFRHAPMGTTVTQIRILMADHYVKTQMNKNTKEGITMYSHYNCELPPIAHAPNCCFTPFPGRLTYWGAGDQEKIYEKLKPRDIVWFVYSGVNESCKWSNEEQRWMTPGSS